MGRSSITYTIKAHIIVESRVDIIMLELSKGYSVVSLNNLKKKTEKREKKGEKKGKKKEKFFL